MTSLPAAFDKSPITVCAPESVWLGGVLVSGVGWGLERGFHTDPVARGGRLPGVRYHPSPTAFRPPNPRFPRPSLISLVNPSNVPRSSLVDPSLPSYCILGIATPRACMAHPPGGRYGPAPPTRPLYGPTCLSYLLNIFFFLIAPSFPALPALDPGERGGGAMPNLRKSGNEGCPRDVRGHAQGFCREMRKIRHHPRYGWHSPLALGVQFSV
jgi:hypothetical protein